MNNIHEKDWAEESWSSHTGMDSECEYCLSELEEEQQAQKHDKEQVESAK